MTALDGLLAECDRPDCEGCMDDLHPCQTCLAMDKLARIVMVLREAARCAGGPEAGCPRCHALAEAEKIAGEP